MLAELQAVHEEILAALAVLDDLTSNPGFELGVLASARVRLSRASGQRRLLSDQLTNKLLETATADEAQQLRELRNRNSTQLKASTAHIGRWGLRDVQSDWRGYCDASRGMRLWMRELIASDQAVLYPLLQRIRV